MGYHYSLSLRIPVHSMVTAGDPGIPAWQLRAPQGICPERDGAKGTLPHFFQQSPRSHTASLLPPPPNTASTAIGAETRTLGGRAEFCKNLGWGYHCDLCGICRLQNLLPCCFLNSASILANASPPHLLMMWFPTSSSPATVSYLVSGCRTHSVHSIHDSDGHSDQQLENSLSPSSLKACHIYLLQCG